MSIFWGLLFLAISLYGLFIMGTNPISKKYGVSQYYDIGIGASLVFFAFVYVIFAYVVPRYQTEDDTLPCGPMSPQAICYGLDPVICKDAWDSFEPACDEEIKPIREKRPSALIHPIKLKCQARKFDKITFYNRRKSDSPFCQKYFKKIDNE
jgi:hypothetical protein